MTGEHERPNESTGRSILWGGYFTKENIVGDKFVMDRKILWGVYKRRKKVKLEEKDPREALHKSRIREAMTYGSVIIAIAAFGLQFIHDINPQDFWPFTPKHYVHAFLELVRDLGIAGFSGGFIAWLIEVSGMINFAKETLKGVLTSNEYLSDLDEGGLRKIKLHCNERLRQIKQIHTDGAWSKGLIAFEDDLDKELSSVFYEYFHVTVNVTREGDFLKKKMLTRYKIVNSNKGPAKETFDIRISIPKSIDNKLQSNVSELTYTIDNGEETPLKGVEYVFENDDKNSLTEYRIKATDNLHKDIEFEKTLTIKLEESRLVSPNDNYHSIKLRRPCLNMEVTYVIDDPEITLIGTVFSSLEPKPGQIINDPQGNVLNIVIGTWLLPHNGVCIHHIKNTKPVSGDSSNVVQKAKEHVEYKPEELPGSTDKDEDSKDK